MAALIGPLHPEAVAERLGMVRERIDMAAARVERDGGDVEILVATKYLPPNQMPVLAQAGVRLVGENRAQDLRKKVATCGELFDFDFIGALQSRKVRAVVPHVRMIHSLASESALDELVRWADVAKPGLRVLVEVNVSEERGKAGIAPAELAGYIERCPVPIAGLMTMPPQTADPERSRHFFAALRELAERHGLAELSMGTSQDYEVAVQEGATIVRLGTSVLV
jgi:pyridoxal phosphate enzyme (YggS family)